MDIVRSLLRTVVRDFYDLRAIIVLDAVMIHHVLSDRDLVTATGISLKDVRMTCARLREDHLIKEVSHKDEGGGGMRSYTQTVFYIHYTEAVDAIKWKMHIVESKLKEELDHKHNAQDYACDRCGAHFETIDAVSLFDPETQEFQCANCGSPLREDDAGARAAAEDPAANESTHMEEFMTQLRPVLTALKQIDDLSLPENSLESELQFHVPLTTSDIPGMAPGAQGAAAYNLPPHLTGVGLESDDHGKASGITTAGSANSRLPQQVQSTFNVNITSEAEQNSEREQALEEKLRYAEENALPEWHTQSTISTNMATADPSKVNPKTEIGAAQESEKADTAAEDAMDAYFKKLQEQQQDNGEEEEDEDDFEDIV